MRLRRSARQRRRLSSTADPETHRSPSRATARSRRSARSFRRSTVSKPTSHRRVWASRGSLLSARGGEKGKAGVCGGARRCLGGRGGGPPPRGKEGGRSGGGAGHG